MRIALGAFVLLVVFLIVVFLVLRSKAVSGMKMQVFGIQLTLVGGVIAADSNSSLGGIEYFIVLLGLMVGTVGFFRE